MYCNNIIRVNMEDISKVHNSVKWQNNILTNQLTKLRNAYSVDKKKSEFILKDFEYYLSINSYLNLIFYLFCLPVIYFTILGKYQERHVGVKVLIILLFLLFPFYIGPLEYLVLSILLYIYALMIGTVYKTPAYVHPPFSFVST